MPAPQLSLEEQLRRSVHQARAKRIQRMTTEAQSIVVHRDVSGPLEFTPEQQQMIRDTYAPGATEAEFRVMMEVSRLRRLNPLLKQIHFVKRKNRKLNRDVWTPQTSIDGMRAIAQRTGMYAGQDEPEYELDKDGFILSCKVKVYRKDWGNRPAVGVAHWSEYVQTYDGKPTDFWDRMPRVMIAKCAEAIAIRKAFPEDAGDLFVDEEMQQADNAPRVDNGSDGAYSPRLTPGQDPNAAPADGGALGDELARKLEKVKAALVRCDTYDKALALRAIIGTRGQQSDLTKRLQAGKESGDVSPAQADVIDKLWMHCDRQVEKLEKKLVPAIEATFSEIDGTEALGAERQPGEDSEEF